MFAHLIRVYLVKAAVRIVELAIIDSLIRRIPFNRSQPPLHLENLDATSNDRLWTSKDVVKAVATGVVASHPKSIIKGIGHVREGLFNRTKIIEVARNSTVSDLCNDISHISNYKDLKQIIMAILNHSLTKNLLYSLLVFLFVYAMYHRVKVLEIIKILLSDSGEILNSRFNKQQNMKNLTKNSTNILDAETIQLIENIINEVTDDESIKESRFKSLSLHNKYQKVLTLVYKALSKLNHKESDDS